MKVKLGIIRDTENFQNGEKFDNYKIIEFIAAMFTLVLTVELR